MRLVLNILFLPIRLIRKMSAMMRKQHRKHVLKMRFSDIEDIISEFRDNPTDFEEYVAGLYRQKGYETVVTKKTNDRGKDIIIWNDDFSYAVEVKLYAQDKKVSREKIQKLHSAMIDSECDGAVFVTTSSFTIPAEEYAEKHNIELIDGQILLDFIDE